jgi:hypothetical protein
MVDVVEDWCPVCRVSAKFEPLDHVRKHYRCGECGEFVVASIAENWLRSSINDWRAREVRRITATALGDQLLVIERDPLRQGQSPTYSFTLKSRSQALHG